MTKPVRPPIGLWLAAVAMAGLTVIPLLLDPSATAAAALGVAAALAVLLLRGSRVAWIVILLGAVGQLVEAAILGEVSWGVPANALLVGCLVVSSSYRFVWERHRASASRSTIARVRLGAQELAYRWLAYFAGWEADIGTQRSLDPGRLRSLLIRVGACTLALLVLVTVTYNWQETQPSPVMGVIADIAWTIYAIFQVAFIALLLVVGYQYLTRERRASAIQGNGE